MAPGDPRIEDSNFAKVKVLTGKQRGKIVFIRDSFLKTAFEAATILGEIDRDREEAKKLEVILDSIDPSEITKAIKAAKVVAGGADLSVRKKVLAREKNRRLAAIAKKYKISNSQLADYIATKNIDQ